MKIAPQVTCDTISLIVEGETYNMDYDFGRRGVRDLGWLLVVVIKGSHPCQNVTMLRA